MCANHGFSRDKRTSFYGYSYNSEKGKERERMKLWKVNDMRRNRYFISISQQDNSLRHGCNRIIIVPRKQRSRTYQRWCPSNLDKEESVDGTFPLNQKKMKLSMDLGRKRMKSEER